MNQPNLLIIGAMKSGTTTLYADLMQHPAVYFPPEKEPGGLAESDNDRGFRQYLKCFSAARPHHRIVGDASTLYAKQPDYTGIARIARQRLGQDLRIIYLVREPAARIQSQIRHEQKNGFEALDGDQALRHKDCYLNYSRYAYQLEEWLEHFDACHVKVIRFENYIANRKRALADIFEFLGIEEPEEGMDPGGAKNSRVTRVPALPHAAA